MARYATYMLPVYDTTPTAAWMSTDVDLVDQIAHNEQGFPVAWFKELTYSHEDKCFPYACHGTDFRKRMTHTNSLAEAFTKVSTYLDRHTDPELVQRVGASLVNVDTPPVQGEVQCLRHGPIPKSIYHHGSN
jgi:hypothetical protein